MEPTTPPRCTEKLPPAFRHRNFRLFWFGQLISLSGSWMQVIAQPWLVLELTHSAYWLGIVGVVQFMPMLLFSLYAGTVIDRIPKKRVLLVTQSVMMLCALVLGFDVWLGTVKLWHILAIAAVHGIANTFDVPGRQSFFVELVGKEDLPSAILMNATVFNATRIIGPSIAGLIIASMGTAGCFFLNGLSFLPVIAGIALIKVNRRLPGETPPAPQATWNAIREGLDFVRMTPAILTPMVLIAIINVFAFNFNVLVPLFAKNVFHGTARDYGFLMAAHGIGAVLGATVLTIRNRKPMRRTMMIAAAGITVFELCIVPVRYYLLAFLFLLLVGVFVVTYTTTTNSLIQLHTPDHLRGRVMSIYSLVLMGLTPLGSFLSGMLAEKWGAPVALGIGAGVSLAVVIGIQFASSRVRQVSSSLERKI